MANTRDRSRQQVGRNRAPVVAPGTGEVEHETNHAATFPRLGTNGPLASVLRAPGGSLALLRAFLGVTFTFAGLQKLANPNFFSATAPGSFEQQVKGAIITSPLHHLLSPALQAPTLIAVLISLGEIAVGIGTLLGLFGRVAALGGMALSLTFFLVVSFNDNPYYYGPDIVFLFAWTPLVLGGSGAHSVDALLSSRARAMARPRVDGVRRPSATALRQAAELERRAFVQKVGAASMAAAFTLIFGGVVAGLGRLFHNGQANAAASLGGSAAPSATTPASTGSSSAGSSGAAGSPGAGGSPGAASSSSGGAKGIKIGPASDVPTGSAASFTDPSSGVPALVVQPTKGTFRAYSAVCPHAGCTVEFDQTQNIFVCPCHGSTFSASSGAVEGGPAPTGLSPITIALGSNGQLYADG